MSSEWQRVWYSCYAIADVNSSTYNIWSKQVEHLDNARRKWEQTYDKIVSHQLYKTNHVSEYDVVMQLQKKSVRW